MLARLQSRLRAADPYLRGAAWFFVVFSLAHLLWATVAKFGDPSGLVSLYRSDEIHQASGLVYDGWFGLFQVCFQLLAVAAAAVVSVTPWTRARRVAHAALVGWSGWWALSLSGLAAADHQATTFGQAMLLSVLFLCTLYRASIAWPQRPAKTTGFIDPPQRPSRKRQLIDATQRWTARAKDASRAAAQRVAAKWPRRATPAADPPTKA